MRQKNLGGGNMRTVYEVSKELGILERDVFVRAHKSYGPIDRSKLERDINRYLLTGAVPEYITSFLIAHSAHSGGHNEVQLTFWSGTRAHGGSPKRLVG